MAESPHIRFEFTRNQLAQAIMKNNLDMTCDTYKRSLRSENMRTNFEEDQIESRKKKPKDEEPSPTITEVPLDFWNALFKDELFKTSTPIWVLSELRLSIQFDPMWDSEHEPNFEDAIKAIGEGNLFGGLDCASNIILMENPSQSQLQYKRKLIDWIEAHVPLAFFITFDFEYGDLLLFGDHFTPNLNTEAKRIWDSRLAQLNRLERMNTQRSTELRDVLGKLRYLTANDEISWSYDQEIDKSIDTTRYLVSSKLPAVTFQDYPTARFAVIQTYVDSAESVRKSDASKEVAEVLTLSEQKELYPFQEYSTVFKLEKKGLEDILKFIHEKFPNLQSTTERGHI